MAIYVVTCGPAPGTEFNAIINAKDDGEASDYAMQYAEDRSDDRCRWASVMLEDGRLYRAAAKQSGQGGPEVTISVPRDDVVAGKVSGEH